MRRIILAAAFIFEMQNVCHASPILTLDSSLFSGNPGDSIDITGTISNPDFNPVFLNNISGLLTSPDLTFDFTDFFTVVPAVLNFGDSYMGPIATVVIDPLAITGDFFGSVTLQGGADQSAFDDLATQNFQFTIAASVPEPRSTSFTIMGLAILIVLRSLRGACPNL